MEHENKLMRLWNNLRPNHKLSERNTMDWVDIGFQGKDPATDFRGAGMFGLENLLAITDEGSPYREEALKIYADSTDKDYWYFFCVAGLNITPKLLSEFTDTHRFDSILLEKLIS